MASEKSAAGEYAAWLATTTRLNQRYQATPRYDLLYLGQEALTAGLLALTGVPEVGKAHLTHGQGLLGGLKRKAISAQVRPGSADLIGESLSGLRNS